MKFKNELMVICLILSILISITAVSAVDNNTDIITTDNNVDDNVLSIDDLNNEKILTNGNDGSFADLNTTINGDSSTDIVLDTDYTYSSTDTIKTGIVISKNNITIDGQGHTIDAKGQTRIFNVTGTTVTLKNIKFINGNAIGKSGGAIYGYGENLRVINCTFEGNNASSWGGAIFSYPDTYAIYVNSTFINNNAECGGAIATYYGFRHNIINCTFDSNYASVEGGAIVIHGKLGTTERPHDDTVNIRSCLFTNNEAPEGAAISNRMSAYINMTDSIILGNPENLVYSWGRMFFADYNWWGTTVDNKSVRPKVTEDIRINNWLYFDLTPHIETSSATVCINNLYDGKTGETSIYSTNKLPLIGVEFEAVNATLEVNNATLDHNGKYELHLVFLGDSVLNATIEDITVSKKNRVGGLKELEILIRNALDDSVIKLEKDYVYTPGIDIKNHGIEISGKHNIVIDGNGHTINGMSKSRLFAVDKDSSDITFKNMKIVNGFTEDTNDGAGAYVLAINTIFNNVTFINNTADGVASGAALRINAHYASVIDCKFINNSHIYSSGGALSWRGDYGSIANTLFENNSAENQGGAIFLWNGVDIVNSTFRYNVADGAGAIFDYGPSNITDCTFIGNKALSDDTQRSGGAIYAINTTITNSAFIDNTAKYGAAIYIGSSGTVIDRSLFINNTATSPNGIIFGGVKGGKVVNSIFLNNVVNYGFLISSIWGGLEADYNWYGNTNKDYTKTPNVSNLAVMSKWIFLNATDSSYDNNTHQFQTELKFFIYDSNTKNVVQFDTEDLPSIYFKISGQNLTFDKNEYAPEETIVGNLTYRITIGEEGTIYIYDYKGTITAEYESFKYVMPVSFQEKSWFEMNSTFELMKGESKYLNFILHPFEQDVLPFLNNAGRITYVVNDTSVIKFDKKTGKVTALKTGLATILIKFDGKNVMGQDRYTKSETTVLVNVTKAETHIKVNVAPEQLLIGDSYSLSASVLDFKNKSVPYVSPEYINNNPELISGTYTIRGLAEGLASITFKFDGNDDYLPCSLDIFIEVGRLDPHLSVSPDNISMKVSNTYYVAVYSNDYNNMSYISNDTSVAIMDGEKVLGIGVGVANITISHAGNDKYKPASTYIIVTVTDVKTYIDVNQTQKLLLTDGINLDAVVRDSKGKLISRLMNYSSNDTSVVTVDEYGRIDAVGEGVANITITFDGHYEYAPSKTNVIVTVTTGESSIDVDSNIDVILYQRISLNAALNHEGKLNYSSSNSSIVSVDQYGYIYGKAIGEAIVTITYEGSKKYDSATANVTVKVLPIPTHIDVEKALAWIIDQNDTINATLNPQRAGKLNFTSNNESVVRVDNKGKITAVGVGKTTIFISFAGNENYLPSNETVEVSVYSSDIPTSIEVNKTFELHVDDIVDLEAVFNPANAGELTYVSSDNTIVKVDSKGKITAVSVGKANITISFAGNERYLSNSTTVLVTVSLINTTIEANDVNVNLTEEVNLDYVFSHPQAGQLDFIFDDISIASIENGKIKGDKLGETTLTIIFEGNNKYATSNTTVKVIVSDVETYIDSDDSLDVNVTESEKIIASLIPAEAGKLRFVSNNKDIISVDSNGYVYGIKLGTGTVTIIFDGDGKYRPTNKTIAVTVKDVETSIEVEDYIKVNITETGLIVANANPKEAGKLHFSTNDNDIISLDEKGNIKGLKAGTATVLITLDAKDKYRASNKTVTVEVCYVPTEIKVENDTIELVYGDETTINAILTPNSDGKLLFNSSNPDVVTVDENGKIKTIKSGEAIITISFAGEGKYEPSNKTVTVIVERAPSSIIVQDNIQTEIGLGYNLKPTTNPRGLDLTYNSTNRDVIGVDENGFIFTVSTGSAVVTVSFAGDDCYLPSSANITVTVSSRLTEIRVKDNVTIGFGDKLDLEACVFLPTLHMTLVGQLNYTSRNPEIASVDKNGVITANKIGDTIIDITYAGDKINLPANASVNVKVTTRTTNIKLDESSISLHVNDTYGIVASLVNGPDDYQLTYTSNDDSIASVNPLTGEITAIGEGNAIITVSYSGDDEYHSSSANFTVSVSRYNTRINSANSVDLVVYETRDLHAVVTPNDGALTYTSSDEDVVTVENGLLTAKKSGSAIITIKFEGDKQYRPSQKQVIVNVAKIPTSINLTDFRMNTGEELDLGKIVLPEGVPTKAKYYEYISWDTDVFDVDNGVITSNHEGSAELSVTFKGDDVYLPCNKTVIVTVVKKVLQPGEYNFTVDVDDDARTATFTAILPDDAEGSFQVIINGEPYAEPIIDGKAVVVVEDLNPGDYKATLRYTGDEFKYASINNATKFHIGRYKIDKNKNIDVYLGKTAKYTVHLTKDTQAMEGKSIKFRVNGKTYYATTDMYGYAFIKVKLPAAKAYSVTAQFGNLKVTNKIKVHVIVAKNIKAKNTKNLKVKISLKKVNKKYLSNKKVTLKFKGKTYTGKTNSKGVVTFNIDKSVMSKLKVGKSYSYVVKYAKDSVTKKIKITK